MPRNYTIRPLGDKLWLRPDGARKISDFTSSWGDTLNTFIAEVYKIQKTGMADPVIELDVRERDIRVDGDLRDDVRVTSPAVLVAFNSIHGPLIYRCDRYSGGRSQWRDGKHVPSMKPWQHNLRAIALTLEALRAVDRYGATRTGEQYRGFRELPSGSGMAPSSMSYETALLVLSRESGVTNLSTHAGLRDAVKYAQAATHPDRNNGDRSRWNAVETAIAVLKQAGTL